MSAPVAVGTGNPEEEPGTLAGWYIGTAAVVAIVLIGLALWFLYHG
jgi:hypothetical protein